MTDNQLPFKSIFYNDEASTACAKCQQYCYDPLLSPDVAEHECRHELAVKLFDGLLELCLSQTRKVLNLILCHYVHLLLFLFHHFD